MSVSILRLNARVLIVALGADLGDDGVMAFQNDLADRTAASTTRGVVIDVSALDIIDSFMARVLKDCAGMLRLLGAEVVVCGIQPAVAMTLVEMGRNLVGVPTAFTLERGLVQLGDLMERADRPAAPRAAEVPLHA
jgi:rsbT antagonist protein RsbS